MLLILASSIVCSSAYPTRGQRSLGQRLTRWFVRPIVRPIVHRWDRWYYRPPTAHQFYSRKTNKRYDFLASVNSELLLLDRLENLQEFEEEVTRIDGASNRGQSTLVKILFAENMFSKIFFLKSTFSLFYLIIFYFEEFVWLRLAEFLKLLTAFFLKAKLKGTT